MNKLIIAACLIALAAVAIGSPVGGLGYGLIAGNGWGNVAAVTNDLTVHGYQLNNVEHGHHSVRSHHQGAVAPVFGHGWGVGGAGLGYGRGLGGGFIGY